MDSQQIVCEHCNAKLKAPAGLPPGKRIKCPKCDAAIVIPSPESAHVAPAASAKKKCPFCGESILAEAVKCRHCGEFLEEGVQRPTGPRKQSAAANSLTPAEYIVAVLAAPIGLIIGIIWKTQKIAKSTEMIKVSGLMCVILAVAPLIYKQYFSEKKPTGPRATASTTPGPGNREPPSLGDQGAEDHDDDDRNRGRGPQPKISAPTAGDLANQPPPIQKAMRCTVCILMPNGGLGTGVIVQREGKTGWIVTNRHVVDMLYNASGGQAQLSASQVPAPKVKFVNDEEKSGKVVWLAGEIDLALVQVDLPEGIEVAEWQKTPEARVGDEVFAIGTPAGLGWTYTKGTISALREHEYGPKKVPVVQTDARIGPGNSGGGLFTREGELIGINTFVVSSSRATAGESGLGFAIKKSVLAELKPEMLKAGGTSTN